MLEEYGAGSVDLHQTRQWTTGKETDGGKSDLTLGCMHLAWWWW